MLKPTSTVSSTRTVMAQVVQPNEGNFLGKVFGGAILAKIDLCAYATASRFAGTICVTASFDRVDFHEPIEVGELVTLIGYVSFVGRTSLEITIEVHAENLMQGTSRHTNTARVTMVALHEGRPVEVPRLICETPEEKVRFLEGKLRRELRTLQRQQRERLTAQFVSAPEAELDRLMEADSLLAALDQTRD
jgi:acyl-CoA hydrolase